MSTIQLHFLTPYSASCLVRGQDGRPKSMRFGGTERGRISSASLKRAIRTSDIFTEEFTDRMGVRTARMGEMIVDKIVESGVEREKAEKAVRVLISGEGDVKKKKGKVEAKVKLDKPDEDGQDESGETGETDSIKEGARLFKLKGDGVRSEQLVFVSHDEVAAAVAVARRIAAGDTVSKKEVRAIVGRTTTAVDVAMFGRMMADRSDLRMISAVDMAHPFTVGRAATEADFYVAADDMKPVEEDVGASFLGEQGFNAGLFYGYLRIDMAQLVHNLGGDEGTARQATVALIRAALTVSPSGKRSSFGSHANATWAMIERGRSASRSLAGAFMAPVQGDDEHAEAVRRAEMLAKNMRAAYGEDFKSESMNVLTGAGSLAKILSLVEQG